MLGLSNAYYLVKAANIKSIDCMIQLYSILKKQKY